MLWLASIALPILLLIGWRFADVWTDRRAWSYLRSEANSSERRFSLRMLDGLPEPARRYFEHTIAPGTLLTCAVEIEMSGEIGMGSKDDPRYQAMRAHQLLAPPYGLIWRLRSGRISGSDGVTRERSWTRFWLLNLIPVVRASGLDHHRSAFGRVVSEAAFWSPASLLPGEHVSWEALDVNTARATVNFNGYKQAIDITVDESGEPQMVALQRWSNANSDATYREQPFGGYLSDFTTVNGYTLPTCVEGGNLIGTAEYFPFYKARVEHFDFPAASP